MKFTIFIITLSLFFIIACSPQINTTDIDTKQVIEQNTNNEVVNMRLTSPAFRDEGDIPPQYTCDGDNINPPLTISDVPDSTISLALVMDDPDAVKPAGKVWDHWVVFNIPPETAEIAEGEEPEGVHGRTSFGRTSYGGPCPPDGKHKYIFKLYALDTELDLEEGAAKAELEKAMKGHIIKQVKLTGDYIRE